MLKERSMRPGEISSSMRVLSPGIAIGSAFFMLENQPEAGENRPVDVEGELQRFDRQVAHVAGVLSELSLHISKEIDARDAQILQAQQMMITDESLKNKVIRLITEERTTMEAAVERVMHRFARRMESAADEYLRQRAADFIDLASYFKKGGLECLIRPEAGIDDESILLVGELCPSIVLTCHRCGGAGILAESGAPISHAAILARSFGIPVLVGSFPVDDPLQNGESIILDAQTRCVIRRPAPSTLAQYQKQVEYQLSLTKSRPQIRNLPAKTKDGVPVDIGVNIGGMDELHLFSPDEIDEVGLFRTEFLFMFDRADFPDFDQQVRWYQDVIRFMHGKPVTFRVLDVGGDKFLPYFSMGTQSNPYLGLRAHRVFRYHPEILETQLRAILQAAAAGPVKILYPMINSLEDIDYLNGILSPLKTTHAAIQVGIMVETPAAVVMIEEILEKVDFVSIGTNDLVQYALTVDRSNENVMSFYQPLHPVILRMIKTVVNAAAECGKPVSICGEVASDPRWTPLLLGMGVRTLSMAPLLVPSIKNRIRTLHLDACRELVDKVLSAKYIEAVERCIDDFMADLN